MKTILNRLFRYNKKTSTVKLIDFLIKNNIKFDYNGNTLCIWNHKYATPMLYIDINGEKSKYFGINVEANSDYNTIISQLKKTL